MFPEEAVQGWRLEDEGGWMGVILAQEGKSIMDESPSDSELEGDIGKGDIEERAVLEGDGDEDFLVAELDREEDEDLSALRVLVRATCVLACSRNASDRVKPRPQLSTGQTKSFSEV